MTMTECGQNIHVKNYKRKGLTGANGLIYRLLGDRKESLVQTKYVTGHVKYDLRA